MENKKQLKAQLTNEISKRYQNRIKELEDKKPTWGNNCIHCTACINRCSKEAIEYGKKTQGKNRYVAIKYKAE